LIYEPPATGTGLFGVAVSVWAVSVWAVSVWGLFSLGSFGIETFRSDYEILHVHFLMKTYLNQRKVLFKKITNMIQDPAVNQPQQMIFIIISKQIKSLSIFCN